MSVHVMSWVLRNSEATLGQRLVLLVIADHASPDGTKSWCSVATIGHEARLSRRAVQDALRRLEASGAIIETGSGPKGTHEYAVTMGGAESAPQGGAVDDTKGAQFTTEGGVVTAPEPSLEQPSTTTVPKTVDRKRVTADEWSLAEAVLEAWNVQTRQSLRSHDWLRKIILRIREHPTLTITEHDDIIRYALAHPWWKGEVGPAVVYGNGALFEQHLMQTAKGETMGSQGAFQIALNALNDARRPG